MRTPDRSPATSKVTRSSELEIEGGDALLAIEPHRDRRRQRCSPQRSCCRAAASARRDEIESRSTSRLARLVGKVFGAHRPVVHRHQPATHHRIHGDRLAVGSPRAATGWFRSDPAGCLIRKRFGASGGNDFRQALNRSVRTKPTVISVITPSPRQAICNAVDNRRRSEIAGLEPELCGPPVDAARRVPRRASAPTAAASSVATPTRATSPPTKMAPVCGPATASAPPPARRPHRAPRPAHRRYHAGVACNARTGGVASPAPPAAEWQTEQQHEPGGGGPGLATAARRRQRREHRSRSLHASAAWAAKASATPSTQAISASIEELPDHASAFAVARRQACGIAWRCPARRQMARR